MAKRESKSKMAKRHRHTLRQLEEKKNKECKKEKDKAKRSEIAKHYRDEIKRVTALQEAEMTAREGEEAAAAAAIEAGEGEGVVGAASVSASTSPSPSASESMTAAAGSQIPGGDFGTGAIGSASCGRADGKGSAGAEISLKSAPRLSRAAKRRLKAQQREKQAVAAAKVFQQSNVTAEAIREAECEAILSRLRPFGMKIKPVAADGNCLFHAVADQLRQCGRKAAGNGAGDGVGALSSAMVGVKIISKEGGMVGDVGGNGHGYSHSALRTAVARYMQERESSFEAFLIPAMAACGASDVEEYCRRLGSSAMYGGEPELKALSDLLKARIHVHSRGGPVRVVGEIFGEGPRDALHICFHSKYLVSANHYNSTMPL